MNEQQCGVDVLSDSACRINCARVTSAASGFLVGDLSCWFSKDGAGQPANHNNAPEINELLMFTMIQTLSNLHFHDAYAVVVLLVVALRAVLHCSRPGLSNNACKPCL